MNRILNEDTIILELKKVNCVKKEILFYNNSVNKLNEPIIYLKWNRYVYNKYTYFVIKGHILKEIVILFSDMIIKTKTEL